MCLTGETGENLDKTPIYLGNTDFTGALTEVSNQQVSFDLDAADATRKNVLISAVDGVGKTHTAAVIVEELANKTDQQVIILDANSEYTTVGTAANQRRGYPFDFSTVTVNIEASKNSAEVLKKSNSGKLPY